MFSRRPGERFNRGRIPAGAPSAPAIQVSQQFVVSAQPQTLGVITVAQQFVVSGNPSTSPPDPAAIFGANLLTWSRADQVTIGASFSWDDKSGNSKPWTNATAAAGLQLTASDATLSNLPTLAANGTSQYCDNVLTRPAPATTPTYIWAIMKQNAWVNNRSIIQDASGSNRHSWIQTGTTPAVTMVNTTSVNSNTALAVGVWKRVEIGFTGSTSDFIKVGSTTTTGASAGNNASVGGRRLCANTALSAFSNLSWAEILYLDVIPSAGQITALDAYANARYGSGVLA